jgi:hypothetical protein
MPNDPVMPRQLPPAVERRLREVRRGGVIAAVHPITLNIARRHLTAAQRREVIARMLVDAPERSDRAVAKDTGASHHTVAGVREGMVERGQIAHADTRTDSVGRQQPASKPKVTLTHDDIYADIVPDGDDVRPATAAELGLTRKEIHEDRKLRDAEAKSAGATRPAP